MHSGLVPPCRPQYSVDVLMQDVCLKRLCGAPAMPTVQWKLRDSLNSSMHKVSYPLPLGKASCDARQLPTGSKEAWQPSLPRVFPTVCLRASLPPDDGMRYNAIASPSKLSTVARERAVCPARCVVKYTTLPQGSLIPRTMTPPSPSPCTPCYLKLGRRRASGEGTIDLCWPGTGPVLDAHPVLAVSPQE